MMLYPNTTPFPTPLIVLEEIDSTNRYLNELCTEQGENVEAFTTVSAERQTAGKGQRGNSWESEEQKNLTFSYVFYPDFVKAGQQFLLSQLISLAIKEALDVYTGDISIKWPNDIYWKERKICGILIENNLTGSYIGRCVAGIGLNINQEVFRSNAPNPVSLKQITGQEHDRYALLAEILTRTKSYYHRLQQDTSGEVASFIADRYASSLFRKEGFHTYEDADGRFLARLLCVEPDGRFVLEDEAGSRRGYLFKEVQYVF